MRDGEFNLLQSPAMIVTGDYATNGGQLNDVCVGVFFLRVIPRVPKGTVFRTPILESFGLSTLVLMSAFGY